jgi:hypothetical protein
VGAAPAIRRRQIPNRKVENMAKRRSVSKTPPKSRAKKPAPIVEAEVNKAIAEDFDERQKLSEPGRHLLREEILEHHSKTPKLAANDIDAAWDDGDGSETVGGHAPTPDQDRVDDLGEAAGLTYADDEPLNFAKVAERDKKRWELNPASADDGDELEDTLIDDDSDEEDEEDLDEIMDDDDLGVLGVLEDEEEEIDKIVVEDEADSLGGPGEDEEEDLDELDDEDEMDDLDLLDDEDDDDED